MRKEEQEAERRGNQEEQAAIMVVARNERKRGAGRIRNTKERMEDQKIANEASL